MSRIGEILDEGTEYGTLLIVELEERAFLIGNCDTQMPKTTTKQRVKTGEILIVEDEKPLARALELKLQRSGFTPIVALNGEDALEHIGRKDLKLILLDLMLPKMDGFSVLKKIREVQKEIPVIVSTNLSQSEDEKRALELGANLYFVKSDTSISDVLENVEKLINA